jgi:HrpA-like RNA helicase
MLKILPVSQSQANQRAGRAGRETAGKCFRLFDESSFESLDISSLPEIQRVGIGQVVLQLKVLGVNSIPDFPFLSPPSPIALKDAIELLRSLGALNKRHELTENGRKMASLPLDPSFAFLLLKSQEFKCVNEMLTAVAVLSSDNLFLQPDKEAAKMAAGQAHRRFAAKEGDLLTVINIYDSWIKSNQDMNWTNRNFLSYRALKHAMSVRKQLSELLTKIGVDITLTCKPEKEPFLRCLAAGLFLNVAKKTADYSLEMNSTLKHKYKDMRSNGAPYKTIRGGQPVHIHPSSTLFHNSSGGGKTLPDCVVYAELLITSKQYLRTVTAIDSSWLPAKNSLNLGN